MQRRSRLSAFLASSVFINGLRFLWVILVVWYEVGTFFWSVSNCRWPDKIFKNLDPSTKKKHVLLVADPQILDYRSYPGRGTLSMRLTQFMVDLNLRKSWNVATRFKPDVVVFLGDMMDNGRLLSADVDYTRYYERFRSIFKLDASVEVLYIPGNHDVGLGPSHSFSPARRQRYAKHFGPFNKRTSVGNHTFVLIDAPGLVEEDYHRAAQSMNFEYWSPRPRGPVEFIRKVAADGVDEPVVLFSHIPLFRPDVASCGPLRERGTIRRGVGHGYQNTLGKQTSQFLLQNVRPSIIFSGDDHDYCEYTHSIPILDDGPQAPKVQHVKEVTVKSFSMAMGIKRPGFHLLSLAALPPHSISPTHADMPCLLPNQLAIYTSRYAPLVFFTLLVLLLVNLDRLRRRTAPSHLRMGTLENGNGHKQVHLSPSDGRRSRSPSPLRGHGHTHARGDSLIWSPASPLPDRSPLSPLAPPLHSHRVPSRSRGGLTPSFRASRPTTPLDTPLLLSPHLRPVADAAGEDLDDDEDLMDPAQFTRRPFAEEGDSAAAQFLPAPGARRARKAWSWSWSWSFVLRGRRRRLTLRAPSISLFMSVLNGLLRNRDGQSEFRRRRGLVRMFLADVVAVAWPPVLVFVIMAWWMFR